MKNIYKIIRHLTYAFAPVKVWWYNLRPAIQIGRGTIIEPGAVIRSQTGGTIRVGKNCYISKGAQLLTHRGDIVIGDNCSVNPYTVIYGGGGYYYW